MKWLPLVAVFGAQLAGGSLKNAGGNVKFRPPPFVFGIVWTILLLLFGESWSEAENDDHYNLYLGTTLLLALWAIVYNMSALWASWLLILVMAGVFACYTIGTDKSKLYLTPLIGWTIFATIMNTTQVQY